MSLRDKINGHLGHIITVIVLLLSLGASYGVVQTKVTGLEKENDRIEARLLRIENKLDQTLLLLRQP